MNAQRNTDEAVTTKLERLVLASRALESALVRSDFGELEAATRELEQAAGELEALLGERDVAEDCKALADTQGMGGNDRFASLLRELRERQERNAYLVLGALKLRAQWRQMLAALASSTYGPSGAKELRPSRRAISRRA